MDEIVILSDSESSEDVGMIVEDIAIPSTSHQPDAFFNPDWINADDESQPGICYDLGSPDNKGTRESNQEEEIEDFITPLKVNTTSLGKSKDIPEYESVIKKTVDNLSLNRCNYNISPVAKSSKSQPFKTKLGPEEKERAKMTKEKTKLEKMKLREEKKVEQLRQKAEKAAYNENRRNLKPEENIKFLTVHIDNEIINAAYGGGITSLLQQNNIQYSVESQLKSHTITWSKRRIEKVVDDFGRIVDREDFRNEDQLLHVLDWQKAVELIKHDDLLTYIETIKSKYLDKKLTLIIYGLEKYLNYRKSERNHGVNGKKRAKVNDCDRAFEEAPFVTRDDIEFALIDLQLLGKHNCRLIETPEEFSALVVNFTKSLSQVEQKIEKQKTYEDLGCFIADSGRSVKVDKNGDGLLRLWQQQICQFSKVGLETAQAIVSQYNSPLALVREYEKCRSVEEGELLLQDIQIRRNAGIFSSTRRVGPQLSKKIYKFFMSSNPDLEL